MSNKVLIPDNTTHSASADIRQGNADLADDLPIGPQRTAPRPRSWRRYAVWAGAVLLLGAMLAGWSATRRPAALPAPVIAESGSLTMRAEVRPARRATLAVINPGTVEALYAEAGQSVESRAPIARVQGPSGAELVAAPWRGTLTTLQVHVGDTLQPGAVIGTVADLGQLQVETVDVDEFQVARLQSGQDVTLTIDALSQTIPGRVRTVALEPLLNPSGDSTYLVIIDPLGRPSGLRSGMTVRVRTAGE